MIAALLNGQAVVDGLAGSRGLHYGDGVFRTLLVHQRQPLDLGRHCDRLEADCRKLHLVPPDRSAVAAEVLQLAQAQERAVIKVLAVRRAGVRGYRSGDDGCDRLVLAYPAPQYPLACWDAGVRVGVSPVTLAPQPLLAGVKHLNRLEQVLASRDWPEGCDEVLVGDGDGHAVGGTRSNLFWSKDGALFTPALDRCGVEGVTRRKIMELATQLEVTVHIVSAPLPALAQASELLVCNALIGIWPVRELAGRSLAAPGPLTRRLMQALNHPRLG